MTEEQLRQLPRASQEDIYSQFYSAYLLAVKSDQMDLEIRYVKYLGEFRQIWDFSAMTVERLEASVRRAHKFAAQLIRENK